MFPAWKRYRTASNHAAKRRWAEPIETPGRRAAAWASALFLDHGIVRPVYWNFWKVTPDLWRGPQPNPFQIAKLARKGLKTIVNLRGPTEYGSYALERDAAKRHGIAFEDAVIWSRSAPRRDQVHGVLEVLARITYPALIHCKSGADRAGLAAALYLIVQKGVPVPEAMGQLSLKYGHFAAGKTGVLDAFLRQYLIDTNGRMPFLTWLDEVYDWEIVEKAHKATALGNLIVDRVLRRE